MIAAAVLVDLAQFGLDIAIIGFIVDTVISAVIGVIFGMWFSHHGVHMVKKNPLGFWSVLAGELIPFINSAPFWTCLVAYTVVNEWRSASQDIL